MGIDYVPAAIEAAAKRRGLGPSYVVGDATRLPPTRSAAAALMDA